MRSEHFLEPVFASGAPPKQPTAASHGLELGLAAVSVLVVAIGFYVAYVFYYKKPGTAAALAATLPRPSIVSSKTSSTSTRSTALIITPLLMFTRLILGGLVDSGIINGSGAAAGATARGLSALVRRVQSGNIRSYAGWLALGAAAVLFVMIFGRSIWYALRNSFCIRNTGSCSTKGNDEHRPHHPDRHHLRPARGRGPAGPAARQGQADAVGCARRHPRHLRC